MTARSLRISRSMVLAFATITGGCLGETGEMTAVLPPATTLGSVTVEPSAVILAVDDTRQLAASGTSLTGMPLASFDDVQFLLATAADSVLLRVSEDGTLTALKPAALVRVNVLAGHNGVFKGNQVLVQVTETPVAGGQLSIQPPDSTRLASGSLKTMRPTLMNPTTGESVPNPVVRYSVAPADEKRVVVHRPTLRIGGLTVQADPNPAPAVNQIGAIDNEGTAWIYGTVEAFGTTLRDSVLFTFTYPFTGLIFALKEGETITSPQMNGELRLAAGATVTFRSNVNDFQLSVSFSFDDPAAATAASPPSSAGGSSGNITDLERFQFSNRQFLTPGSYNWTATAAGPEPWNGKAISGRIVIR